MNIKFNIDGFEPLENRDVYFENTTPVNLKEYNFFKSQVDRNKRTEFSYFLIQKIFNPVVSVWNNRHIHTSIDRFKMYCNANNLVFHERTETGGFIVENLNICP